MIPDHSLSRLVVYTVALCQTALAPFAFVYFLYYLYVSQTALTADAGDDGELHYFLPMTIHYWLATELMFYIFFQITRNRMQQTIPTVDMLTGKERRALVSLCISNIENVQEWLPGWFIKKVNDQQSTTTTLPTIDEIYRDNVIEWLSWAFFSSALEDVLQHSDLVKEIEWMLSEFETTFQYQFPDGYNEQLHSRRLNLDPINAYHRPLLFYICIQLLTLFYETVMLQWYYGMKKFGPEVVHSNLLWNPVESSSYPPTRLRTPPSYRRQHYFEQESVEDEERISYWFRDGDRRKKPVVFIHGIGAGLMCYTPFIHHLMQLNCPIFCIELPFVAMRCVEDVPTMPEISRDIQQMLHRHQCQHAVFVAHSLGTAVASWSLRYIPKSVAGVVLLDPICFMLHYHDICTNFVYRTPETASESIVKYFASSELYISYYISRHFHWFQCALYVTPTKMATIKNRKSSAISKLATASTTPMPRQTKVYLSERDNIVNSPRVDTYLSKHGLDCEMMKGLDHASFLLHSEWQRRIISTISDFIHEK